MRGGSAKLITALPLTRTASGPASPSGGGNAAIPMFANPLTEALLLPGFEREYHVVAILDGRHL